MENDVIRTSILLDRGANIYEYVLKARNHDFLFHHPRVKPSKPVLGALQGIDNWWHGGIDEILPTILFSTYRGDEFPIIGELWAHAYSSQISTERPDEVEVYLQTDTTISPFKIEKWVSLKSDDPILRIKTRITNTGYDDFDFLWGYHSTFAVNSNCRIDIPVEKMVPEDVSFSKFKPEVEYQWPNGTDKNGRKYDLTQVLEPSTLVGEFHHSKAVKEGWAAVTNSKEQIGFGIVFPKEILTTLYLWLNYGAWRNAYNVGLYPVSGYPATLHKAAESRTCSRLDPSKSMECEVKFVCFSGLSRVSTIDVNGKVT